MVSEKPVVIFSKNSCCMSHSIKTLFVDFGVNPTIYETVEATVSANPLLGSEEHNERDEIVKEINEPNSRWKAVFSDRFANTTFFGGTHMLLLNQSIGIEMGVAEMHSVEFYFGPDLSRNYGNQSCVVILRLWNYVHWPNFSLLVPLPSILQDVTLLSIPELPRLLNPYLKNIVVNKTNHMIDDESILEKAIGTEIEWFPIECLDQKVLKLSQRRDPKHGMAFPKSSFTKGKWSTTMILGEAVAANDLEMDEVQ
ncbi:hypothetical protein F2Q69_00059988 [Brassica cretica]|uniref:Glutaredoxin domain-containing protein n=1 Tax=Brassica cretica TaxID=69181 RepID=A0A8S9RL97_BRACR|nr:hypothetical protein F2Q69_00059988 [Brassica cretica]